MQSLVVLIKYEKSITEENKLVIDDMLNYAQTNLFSSSPNLRTMSLALYSYIVEINYEIVEKVINIFQ